MILLKKNASYKEIKNFFITKNIKIKKIDSLHQVKIFEEIKKKIKENFFSKTTSAKRLCHWNSGWNNSIKYKNVYIPNYYAIKNNILRISGKYYVSTTKFNTYRILQLILEDVFNSFKKKIKTNIENYNILEFGAGSGSNLVFLKKKNIIKKKLLAFDFSKNSLNLIKKNAINNKIPIETYNFNIKRPAPLRLDCSADIILTCYSLEQVFKDYKKFLNYLRKLKPKYIINIEPIAENYDKKNPFDLLAHDYHNRRKYLHKYKTYLKILQKKYKISILSDYKYYFGSKYDDSSSVLIWKFK